MMITLYKTAGLALPSLFWMLLPLLAVAALAVGWKYMTDYVFSRLEYSREFTEEGAFEGEGLCFVETVVNPTPFPIFFLDAEAYLYSELELADYIPERDNNMQYMVSRFNLMPYMKIKRKHNINCKKRGHYAVESVQLWKGKRNRYVDSPAEVYVYPAILDSGFYPSPMSVLQGNNVSSRRLISDPFSFAGIRDYRFGDSLSSVNFKASAKAPVIDYSSIKVNKRDHCSNRNIMICINFQTDSQQSIPAKEYGVLMERALSFASALIFEAISQGYKVGISANCRTSSSDKLICPMLSGNAHYIELLKGLSQVRTQAGASVVSLFERDLESCVSLTEYYFMTTYVSDLINEKISSLERYSNTVNIIMLDGIFGGEGGGGAKYDR